MKLSALDQKHPSHDAPRWCELEALSKGGNRFRALIAQFLPKNPSESDHVYCQRRSQAHYISYMGAITTYYVAWLFSASMSPKAYKRGTDTPVETLPAFYGQFSEAVCKETSLAHFVRDRFREALTTEKSHWLLEKPSNNGVVPADMAEHDARDLGRVTLKAIDRAELLDWDEDGEGRLTVVKLHTIVEDRPTWATPRGEAFVETWRVYDAESCTTFEYRYKKGERSSDPNFQVNQLGESVPHGFKRVPFITLGVPNELCIGEQTRDSQVEHFRLNNGLSWLIRRTCYAQPVWKLADADAPPQIMGAGREIVIGNEDDFMWTAPPNAPFDILQKAIDAKRDEMYRIVHQLAQGLDNNAETVGRSADSKEIDAAATRILLNAYSSIVCHAVEETYETISESRGDNDYEWSVEGFEGYDTATATTLLANTALANMLSIPSQTFHKEMSTKAALALLPGADQRVKDTIRDEINGAEFDVTQTSEAAAKIGVLAAKAELDKAKAKSEPVKASAAMKSASRPAPKPISPTMTKSKSKG